MKTKSIKELRKTNDFVYNWSEPDPFTMNIFNQLCDNPQLAIRLSACHIMECYFEEEILCATYEEVIDLVKPMFGDYWELYGDEIEWTFRYLIFDLYRPERIIEVKEFMEERDNAKHNPK